MSQAYLTIDDSPTRHTPEIMDYLCARGIVPVMNFIGAQAEKFPGEAAYAIQKGAVIGNHSHSHPRFSALSLDECRREIRRTEDIINAAYARAGVARAHRVFRFPYGDKGGANAPRIQEMLRGEFGFDRLDDRGISFPWWKENHLDADVDMLWTFDFCEYRLIWNDGFAWDDIIRRVLDKNPAEGGALLGGDAHIVLIHDIEAVHAFAPGYFQRLIDYVTARGCIFIQPVFMTGP